MHFNFNHNTATVSPNKASLLVGRVHLPSNNNKQNGNQGGAARKHASWPRPFCCQLFLNPLRLLILLALIVGVLYCIHLLVKDYQALTASRLLRLLFKRDVTAHNISKPHVRWKKILLHDPIQCARYLFCNLGIRQADNEVKEGFIIMLSLEPQEEDRSSLAVFREAYNRGVMSKRESSCRWHYPLCPFKASMLFDLVYHLLGETNGVSLLEDGGEKSRQS